MDFRTAAALVTHHGLAMVTDPHGGVAAVGVGRKGGGPIEGASEFTITVFVPEKLTPATMQRLSIRSAGDVVRSATASSAVRILPDDLNVVESGSLFAPRQFLPAPPGLAIPIAQRGVYGGAPAILDTQKWFSSLRLGIGLTNPVGQYPGVLSVGTLGFCMRDGAGGRYLVSNNHVIGLANAASPGDAIVQPGTLDLTGAEIAACPTLADLTKNLQIAELTAFVPLKWYQASSTWIGSATRGV
jgi:hypothetical protein